MRDRDWDDYIKGVGWWGSWRRGLEGPGGGGGQGDGWTAIAFLLLVGFGLWVAFSVLVLIIRIYIYGISPYIYFYAAIMEQANLIILLFIFLFLISQFSILPIFYKNGAIRISIIYLVLLPVLNVLMYYFGRLAIKIVPASIGLEGALWRLSNEMPQRIELNVPVRADFLAHAIPFGLAGLAFFIAGIYVLLKGAKYLYIGSVIGMRRAAVGYRRAIESVVGKAILVTIAVVMLTASARLVPLSPDMPFLRQTGTLVLIGMIYGWRLTTIAVALWLSLVAAGLPVFFDQAATLEFMSGPMAGYFLGLLVGGVVAGLRGNAIKFGQVLMISLAANVAILIVAVVWLAHWADWTSWNQVPPRFKSGVLPVILGVGINSIAPACLLIVGDKIRNAGVKARGG